MRSPFRLQFTFESYYLFISKGGTVDITVHEVVNDKELRELHRASGGAWGGTKVDDAFEIFLGNLLGKDFDLSDRS
jgi:hypothetical protein